MTEDELKVIEERAAKATPGPWLWVEKGIGQEWGHGGYDLETESGTVHPCSYFCGAKHRDSERHIAADATVITSIGYDADSVIVENGADYDFIAHARTDVPELVAEVRRLREWFQYAFENMSSPGVQEHLSTVLSDEAPPFKPL